MSLPVSSRQMSFGQALTSYPHRQSTETILYQVVQENLETFIQEAGSSRGGKGLPSYVKREFYEYLRCGVLAYGFLRLQCQDCHQERLLPFSCRGRGFCPSCGGRRMSELAAFLVDEVFPHVPIRQVVLTFPFPVRFWLTKNPRLQTQLLTIAIRAYRGLLRKKAKEKNLTQKLDYAVVTVIQRFGGSVNANPHMHMLWVDGLYDVSQGEPKFIELPPPTDDEIRELVGIIATRITRALKRKGYRVDELCDEEISDEEDTFGEVQSASVQSLIALGERRGKKVRRLGVEESGSFEGAIIEGPRCASVNGFSLHANISCLAEEREKLEHMARYIARPPVAIDRLSVRPDGLITYRLKKPYRDGTEWLLFSPMEFMEKLSALVPQPRFHTVRYHGVFAPHSKVRGKIVLGSLKPKTEATDTKPEPGEDEHKAKMTWARLLHRVFNIDVTVCQHCAGEIKVLAAIMERSVIEKILSHMGLPTEPPPITPARPPPQQQFDLF